MKRYALGDSCLCWSLSDAIDAEVSARILWTYRRLKNGGMAERGILDLVPSYNALAVHFDPLETDGAALEAYVSSVFAEKPSAEARMGKTVEIPVRYDGEDLGRVADLHDLTIREAIDLHKASVFTVAMVGFMPNFPYLIGLDPRLETPRLDCPRLKVPAGAVAIGGAQTGIYPRESPGGWNLIGSTDPRLLLGIEPGDTVVMKEIL